MKKWSIVVALLAIATVATGPTLAARNTQPATSSISLASVDGSDALRVAVSPHLGAKVAFATAVEPIAGWEYPMIAVWCYQDLNGDGIQRFPNDKGDLVYMELNHPDSTFVLGGGWSKWVDLGGAAECDAILYAYGNKGKTQSIRELARTGFSAAA